MMIKMSSLRKRYHAGAAKAAEARLSAPPAHETIVVEVMSKRPTSMVMDGPRALKA
jgi:hypothetical protein